MSEPRKTKTTTSFDNVIRERELYREALVSIKNMKPSEIAPGIQHGPALLFSHCQRIARRALQGKKP